MGVSLIDQNVLYSSSNANIGLIDVEPVYTRSLPEGVWAAFDLRSAVDTSTMKWADQSGNENEMSLTKSGSGDIWDDINKCIICNVGNYVTGIVENENLASGQFIPASSYTFNALVEWNDAAATSYGDTLFDMQVINDMTADKYSLHRILRASGSEGKMTYTGKASGGSSATKAATTAITSGIRLLTWVIDMSGTITFYCDGESMGSAAFDPAFSVKGSTPDLRFLAQNTITSQNDWHFYGKCYAINVYNKVLSSSEIGECIDFYAERYGAYQPT